LIKLDRALFLQFIKFGIVGLSNTAISYGIYAGLVYFSVYYITANVIAFVVSVFNSFFWNNKYVFTKNKDAKRSMGKVIAKTFIAYGFTGLVLANILLYLSVNIAGISKYIAPLFVLTVTVPLNFVLNKFWAFKNSKIEKVSETNIKTE
jgi:putative flippase GtrA